MVVETRSTGTITVSVVIPARNEECHVRAALASVAVQAGPGATLEAVVVDNGSTDHTAEQVEAFAAEHPELAVRLLSEPRPGVARARNRGAAAALGEWIVFLDADSRLAPDLVACVRRRACAGWPAGSIRLVADSTNRVDQGFFRLMEFGKVLFGIRAQMFYCRRDLWERFGGFDERLQCGEDREFLTRLQRAGIPVCHLSETWIATSTRRLHARPFRLGMLAMFGRWALAQAGIGRQWRY